MYLKPVIVWIRKHNILPNILTYRVLVQLSRYLVTGLTAFSFEYFIFAVLISLTAHNTNLSNTVAMICGFTISFLLNRHWSFKSKSNPSIQIIYLVILFLFNLWLSNFVIDFVYVHYGLTPFISKPVMMVLISSWNFILYKKFIYR